MKKIVTVLGARPQFIKASVVSKAIEQAGKMQEIVVHTGQHFDSNMSDLFFQELGMNTPKHHLQIGGGWHGEMTGRMLVAIERVLMEEKPDAVMVYGDTNSTLAGALAAVKLGIPVAHVEAGLRSFNMAMPEEINRILTDRISRWLFTPTEAAECHLRGEGVEDEKIISVGDVMYDVALYQGAQSEAASEILLKLGLTKGSYALATIHRAENTDKPERLAEVVGGLVLLAETIPVVWPLHPRTRGVLGQHSVLQSQASRLCLVDPVGYLDMVKLERSAGLIVTDSGGVQKEAFFHQVPCVTLRAETEWTETVELGWNRLCPTHEPRQLAQTCLEALHTSGRNGKPYGAGDAAQKIAAFLATRIGPHCEKN